MTFEFGSRKLTIPTMLTRSLSQNCQVHIPNHSFTAGGEFCFGYPGFRNSWKSKNNQFLNGWLEDWRFPTMSLKSRFQFETMPFILIDN